MNAFHYREDSLFVEDLPLRELAERHGTPLYVYSRRQLEQNFLAYQRALGLQPHLICYAVKANSNLAVLNVLARLGSGFDIVSGGELARVLAAGGDPDKVVFSGIGKSAAEMRQALEAGIHCFNVESESELERLNAVALELGLRAPVSLRVNPDVDARTHPYISTGLRDNKFGVDINQALHLYRRAYTLPGLRIRGVDCHIGSQLTSLSPFLDAVDRLLKLLEELERQGIRVSHLDLGGGLGVRYTDESPPTPARYVQALREKLAGRELKLLFEPGRSICADAGVLLTRVEYLKPGAGKNFAIVDGAMNDLLRPALYQAWMDIVPVERGDRDPAEARVYDVVGPVCESSDFLGKDRQLAVREGDLLAVLSAGAYGFTMSSNYNTRNRAAEVMVDGGHAQLVRRRETFADQLGLESVLEPHAAMTE